MGPPREKSVMGILTFSLLLASVNSWPEVRPGGLALALTAYLLHLFTFDDIFYRRLDRRAAALIALNLTPYLAAAYLGYWWTPAFSIAALFAAYLYLALKGRGRSVEGVMVGTAMLASTYLLYKSMISYITPKDLVVYLLVAGYHVATAYYVESRLAFRQISPVAPLYVWTPVVSTAALYNPAFLIAAAEPTAKFIYNAWKNVKISNYREIVKMGWRELARSALFVSLLGLVYRLA